MKKFLISLTLIYLFSFTPLAFPQTWQWVRTSTGMNNEGFWDVAVLGRHVYSSMLSNSTIYSVFGDTTINSNPASRSIMSVYKWDDSGSLIWSKRLQGYGPEISLIPLIPKIAVDNNSSVILTSVFLSDSLISDSAVLINDTTAIAKYFVCKIDSVGNTIWMRTHSTKNKLYTEGLDVVTNSRNEVIASMIYSPDTLYLSTDTFYNSYNANDFVFIKYNTSGQVIWARSPHGNNNELVLRLAVDGQDNIIGGGRTNSDSIWWDNYVYRTQVVTRGKNQILIFKCNDSGQVQWVKSFGGSDNDFLTGIDVDGLGNIYGAGFFYSDSIVFDNLIIRRTNPGSSFSFSMFMFKLDSSGNVIWARAYGGSKYNKAEDIKVNPEGDFYVSGYFTSDSIQFDQFTIYPTGSTGFFCLHCDSSGHALSIKQLIGADGIDLNYGRNTLGSVRSLCIDPNDRSTLYTAGLLSGAYLDFDGTVVNNSNPLIMNTTDAFIAKLSGFPLGVSETVHVSHELTIYPQPTSGKFQIKGLPRGNANILIQDPLGRMIMEKVINTSTDQELDLSAYPAGVYLILVDADGVQWKKKIVVSR